jgi:hypothetical protein
MNEKYDGFISLNFEKPAQESNTLSMMSMQDQIDVCGVFLDICERTRWFLSTSTPATLDVCVGF